MTAEMPLPAACLQQFGMPFQVFPLSLDFGEEEHDHHDEMTLYFNRRARHRLARALWSSRWAIVPIAYLPEQMREVLTALYRKAGHSL